MNNSCSIREKNLFMFVYLENGPSPSLSLRTYNSGGITKYGTSHDLVLLSSDHGFLYKP